MNEPDYFYQLTQILNVLKSKDIQSTLHEKVHTKMYQWLWETSLYQKWLISFYFNLQYIFDIRLSLV